MATVFSDANESNFNSESNKNVLSHRNKSQMLPVRKSNTVKGATDQLSPLSNVKPEMYTTTAMVPWLLPVIVAACMIVFLVISFTLHHRRVLRQRHRLYQQHFYLQHHQRVAGPMFCVEHINSSMDHTFLSADGANTSEKPSGNRYIRSLRRCYSWSPRIFKGRQSEKRLNRVKALRNNSMKTVSPNKASDGDVRGSNTIVHALPVVHVCRTEGSEDEVPLLSRTNSCRGSNAGSLLSRENSCKGRPLTVIGECSPVFTTSTSKSSGSKTEPQGEQFTEPFPEEKCSEIEDIAPVDTGPERTVISPIRVIGSLFCKVAGVSRRSQRSLSASAAESEACEATLDVKASSAEVLSPGAGILGVNNLELNASSQRRSDCESPALNANAPITLTETGNTQAGIYNEVLAQDLQLKTETLQMEEESSADNAESAALVDHACIAAQLSSIPVSMTSCELQMDASRSGKPYLSKDRRSSFVDGQQRMDVLRSLGHVTGVANHLLEIFNIRNKRSDTNDQFGNEMWKTKKLLCDRCMATERILNSLDDNDVNNLSEFLDSHLLREKPNSASKYVAESRKNAKKDESTDGSEVFIDANSDVFGSSDSLQECWGCNSHRYLDQSLASLHNAIL